MIIRTTFQLATCTAPVSPSFSGVFHFTAASETTMKTTGLQVSCLCSDFGRADSRGPFSNELASLRRSLSFSLSPLVLLFYCVLIADSWNAFSRFYVAKLIQQLRPLLCNVLRSPIRVAFVVSSRRGLADFSCNGPRRNRASNAYVPRKGPRRVFYFFF